MGEGYGAKGTIVNKDMQRFASTLNAQLVYGLALAIYLYAVDVAVHIGGATIDETQATRLYRGETDALPSRIG